MLTNVLGDVPSGRLHRALVQKQASRATPGARSAGCTIRASSYFGASLPQDGKLDPAREALVAAVEGLKSEPIRAEEVERARTALLNDFEKTQLETGAYVRALSEFAAIGDWRLFFLYRERLKKVTLADVQRVAEHYLKPANRVLGTFVPTDAPDRADIPPSQDMAGGARGLQGRAEGVRLGEAFDPSPEEHRVARGAQEPVQRHPARAAAEDARAAAASIATLTLHWGDEKTPDQPRGRRAASPARMLMRGTQKKQPRRASRTRSRS